MCSARWHRLVILTLATPVVVLTAQGRDACVSTTGVVGIGEFRCISGSCWIEDTPRQRAYGFSTEPRLHRLETLGLAARNGLRDGDVLAAIDGVPIILAAAGRRLANLAPGRSVRLTIRRGDRLFDLSLIPTSGCDIPGLAVSPTGEVDPGGLVVPAPDLDGSINNDRRGAGSGFVSIRHLDTFVRSARMVVTGGPIRIRTDPATGELVILLTDNEIRITPDKTGTE
jgi:hypothetical protein